MSLIIKATIILLVASGVARAAKRCSAAERHIIWVLALASCVWLAVSSPIAPRIAIRAPRPAPAVVLTASRVHDYVAAVPRASLPSLPATRSPVRPLIALWIIGCVLLCVRGGIGLIRIARLARHASIASDDEAAAFGLERRVRVGYSADVGTPITFGIASPLVLLPADARS